MFKNLFKLFGANKKKDKSHIKDEELSVQIDNPIKDFQNRAIHDVLTSEIIDSTPDDELAQLVFDNLLTKFSDDYKKELETVLSFPKPRQAIYIIWVLEAEVLNGGFNQYYYNSNGKYAEMLPEALQLIGALKYASIVSRANFVYEDEYDQITKYQDGSIEGVSKSYDDNPLDALDDEFYDLEQEENLYAIMGEFIRRNKEDFIG